MLKRTIRFLPASLLITALCSATFAQSNSGQATEAAKKHRAEKAAPTAAASGKKPVQPTGSVAQRLAACKASAGLNVLKREQCVWDMCKGRWGKDGCPKEAAPNLSSR